MKYQQSLIEFKSKVQAIRLVLFFSFVIMIVKFIAFWYTKSNAVLSDALESFINIATSSFTLYSLFYSFKLKDSDHPYGHGKIEYFAIGFEGALILGTGVYILYKSILNFIHPQELTNIDEGILITAASGIAMYFIGTFLKKKGREMNSQLLIADGKHFHVDTLTSIGLVVGLSLYKITGLSWIDPALAAALAFHIMFSGIKLVKEAINHLLDKADVNAIEEITTSLQNKRRPNWIDVHNLRVQKFGQNLHVDCHITMPFFLSLDQVHIELKNMENDLNSDFSHTIEFFVHTDPCNEEFPCDICTVSNCEFRKKTYVKELQWTSEVLMKNKKHKLTDH